MKQRSIRFQFNAPCILGLTLLSFIVLIVSMVSSSWLNSMLMCYKTSWTDPWQYVRLFTHVLPHSGFSHYSGNFLLILAVGPMVEEKYGSGRTLMMILITAAVTGLFNIFFAPNTAIMGASGLVFMLILLASFVNIRSGYIPITVVLVAILYIGQEVYNGIFSNDSISQLSHIIGGLCGTVFGIAFHRSK